MAGRIVLQSWPTCYDCFSWSDDDRLAVGGGEVFTVLSPLPRDSNAFKAYREITIVKANEYTEAEAPLLDLLSTENFSLGEEQSLGHVQAVAWSNPGLSRHYGCVLAVLGSNHILSIWEAVGSRGNGETWIRKTVVNHALIRHYGITLGSPNFSNETDKILHDELKQVAQRITAFTWASKETCQVLLRCRYCQLLAVATEVGDIFLLSVKSPYDILDFQTTDWQVQIVSRCNIKTELTMAMRNPLSFGPRRDPAAESLSWGPLNTKNDSVGAQLVYVVNGILLAVRVVQMNDTPAQFHFDTSPHDQLTLKQNMRGPLRFCPGTKFLLAFADNAIHCFDLSTSPATEVSHDLDGRWDSVTSVAFSLSKGRLMIHIASLLSSLSAPTASLSLPDLQPVYSVDTVWQEVIKESRTIFGVVHDLNSRVQERVWGITASPFGDYVATGTTLHPSESLAYIIRSEEKLSVDITHEPNADHDHLQVPMQFYAPFPVPAQPLLFRMERQVEQQGGFGVDTGVRSDITRQVAACLQMRPTNEWQEMRNHCLEPSPLVAELERKLFTVEKSIEIRSHRLVAILYGEAATTQHDMEVTRLLISAVLSASLQSYQNGAFGEKILNNYKYLQTQVCHPDPNLSVQPVLDSCSLCGEDMIFQSIKWAKCGRGHQFSRCALTFLPIHKPEIRKTCSICSLQYLDELLISAMNGNQAKKHQIENYTPGEAAVNVNGESPQEPPTSLARNLFAACSMCVHCGGKFQT